MKTLKQICLKDIDESDAEGKRLVFKRGLEYITSVPENEEVTVFTSVWATVPAELFGGGIPGPGDSHEN